MLLYVVLYVFVSVTVVAWLFFLDIWRLVPDSLSHLHTRVLAYAPRKLFEICVTRAAAKDELHSVAARQCVLPERGELLSTTLTRCCRRGIN